MTVRQSSLPDRDYIVTTDLALYRFGSSLLEPIASLVFDHRARQGKERAERKGERLGRATAVRPPSPVIWLHGASVGESRLLLEVFAALKAIRPDVSGVVTTQTLTSADMIAKAAPPGLVHQMAPVDAPGPVKRFLDHWEPDLAVFAEGEIWPNMLTGLKSSGIRAALVNARMTTRSIEGWNRRKASAQTLFSAFEFIGAADRKTAEGLEAVTGRKVNVLGNLKQAAPPPSPDAALLQTWRETVGARPMILAASTHPGEEAFVVEAFLRVRETYPKSLLVIAPRHPERGSEVAAVVARRGLNAQMRSVNSDMPPEDIDVFIADTLGELMTWYAASCAIYLGGATAMEVGGHNPFEPIQINRRLVTGPNGYNFAAAFEALEAMKAIEICRTTDELAAFWEASLASSEHRLLEPAAVTRFLEEARAPFDATVSALVAALPPAQKVAAHA